MPAKSQRDASRSEGIKPGVIVIGIVALILILGVLAWRNFGANAGPVSTLNAQQRSDLDWMQQKAKESGGDINKLSAEDQRKLYTLHGNMAPYVLKHSAQPATDNF